MTAIRAAGYCPNCNRGVSIVKPQPSGLMKRMKSALQSSDNDSGWVCSKCGQSATKGFAPPPSAVEVEENATPSAQPDTPEPATASDEPQVATAPEPAPAPEPATAPESPATNEFSPATEKRSCPSCGRENPARAEICAACSKDMNTSDKLEATCHLCSKPIEFKASTAGDQVTCPGCSASVILPESLEDSSALTRAPAIMKLDDDPERPDVSKALCTECNFELTYPKRLAGKNVDCPSCSVKFILP